MKKKKRKANMETHGDTSEYGSTDQFHYIVELVTEVSTELCMLWLAYIYTHIYTQNINS